MNCWAPSLPQRARSKAIPAGASDAVSAVPGLAAGLVAVWVCAHRKNREYADGRNDAAEIQANEIRLNMGAPELRDRGPLRLRSCNRPSSPHVYRGPLSPGNIRHFDGNLQDLPDRIRSDLETSPPALDVARCTKAHALRNGQKRPRPALRSSSRVAAACPAKTSIRQKRSRRQGTISADGPHELDCCCAAATRGLSMPTSLAPRGLGVCGEEGGREGGPHRRRVRACHRRALRLLPPTRAEWTVSASHACPAPFSLTPPCGPAAATRLKPCAAVAASPARALRPAQRRAAAGRQGEEGAGKPAAAAPPAPPAAAAAAAPARCACKPDDYIAHRRGAAV